MDHTYPYIASLTREPFLFHEMRITARLMNQGMTEDEVIGQVISENLFQYPTAKSLRSMTRGCIKRLKALGDAELLAAISGETSDIAKQICLYAMMRQSRLIWEFMLTVIGEKYRTMDDSFGRMDLNVFFMRLQEQNDTVAGWSDSTVAKLRQIMVKTLVETGYLDHSRSDRLNAVYLQPILEQGIRRNGDEIVFPAFNFFQ